MYPNPNTFAPRSPAPLAATAGEARLAYLRKVYAIFLGGVLSAAVGAMAALYVGEPVAGSAGRLAVPPMIAFVGAHPFIAIIVYFAAFFGANAVRGVRGLNVAALFGFTFVSGLFVAPILFIAGVMAGAGQTMTANPVRDAFLLAVAGFGGLTTYTVVSRRDFSFLGGFLWMGLIVLLVASLIGMFVGGAVFQLAIASVGVLLFGGYVLYDTSRLLHAEEPPAPVTAALQLYLDFFNMFLFILRILMSSRRD